MALPTLIGNDGRKAVIAFTGTETISRWRADARPVPVPAARLWPAVAAEQADAVVIDVAGPVPLVIEGARLAALAGGAPPPPRTRTPTSAPRSRRSPPTSPSAPAARTPS